MEHWPKAILANISHPLIPNGKARRPDIFLAHAVQLAKILGFRLKTSTAP
jgi:hypothetical protein